MQAKALTLLTACALAAMFPTVSTSAERPTMAGVLEAATEADWRTPDPANLLILQLPGGRVIMELAPDFAPNVIENIRQLTRDNYYASNAIIRSQENYVAQWGDPDAETESPASIGKASATVEAEFYRSAKGLDVVRIDSRDAYADIVGFAGGFPVGMDADGSRVWLTHCYGAVGISRDNAANSGNGTSLYVITGHAPRHLDRNVVVIGRVLRGMELLTTLPRGTGDLGFYETAAEMLPVSWMKFAADLPLDERVNLQVFRTDTDAFKQLVEARRYRTEEWFVDPAGRIGLCNIPIPVREHSLE